MASVHTKQEMEAVLDPMLYTGRCAEQVESYVKKVAPLIAGIDSEQAEINI